MTAVTKNLTSTSGTRSVRFRSASRTGRPNLCSSNSLRNSDATGSESSFAISSSAVVNACPARTARVSVSMASGKSSSNFRKRLLRRWEVNEYGRSAPRNAPMPAKSNDSFPGREPVESSAARPRAAPLSTQRIRMLPARIFKSAWESMVCRLEIRVERRRRLSSAGISLNISSRSRASSSLGWRSAAFCTLASRSRSSRARALRWSSREPRAKTPSETTTNTMMAIRANIPPFCNRLPSPACLNLHPGFKKRGTQPATCSRQPVGKFGPDPDGAEGAPHFAAFVNALPIEYEDVLHGDDVALHAGYFRDGDHFARAVRQARDLYHGMNGRHDLLLDGPLRDVQVGHGEHVLQAGQGVTLRVGVHRGQGAFVAGVHGLQHVERLFATHLAYHNAVGPHPQAVDDQLPLPHCTFAFNVGRPGFQPYHVFLL